MRYANHCPHCEHLLVAHSKSGCMVPACGCTKLRGGLFPPDVSADVMAAELRKLGEEVSNEETAGHPRHADDGGVPSDEIAFPKVDEIVAANGAFHLLDEEWRHPETRLADASTPPAGGDSSLDWTSLRQVNDPWARIAMQRHGRVGRDPARIEPFLRFFEVIWNRHSHLRFGQLVSDAMSLRDPRLSLHGPEDETFVQLLGEWDDVVEAGGEQADPMIDEHRLDRRSERIRPFLDRFHQAWELGGDQRFGQLVANIIRFKHPLDSITSIADEDYLELIDEWIAERSSR